MQTALAGITQTSPGGQQIPKGGRDSRFLFCQERGCSEPAKPAPERHSRKAELDWGTGEQKECRISVKRPGHLQPPKMSRWLLATSQRPSWDTSGKAEGSTPDPQPPSPSQPPASSNAWHSGAAGSPARLGTFLQLGMQGWGWLGMCRWNGGGEVTALGGVDLGLLLLEPRKQQGRASWGDPTPPVPGSPRTQDSAVCMPAALPFLAAHPY